jgi:hypothetical protein
MQGCVPEIQAMGNSTLGLAQTPEAPKLSRQDVKKTGNGWKALRGRSRNQCGSEPARDEASTFNNDVE